MDQDLSSLRFLSASRIETPAGNLSGAVILGADDRAFGKLEGIIIDPIERQVRYFVLKSRHGFRVHRYLFSAPLCVERGRKALRLVGSAFLEQLSEITPDRFSSFVSDAA